MESNWNQLIDRYFAGELSEDGLEAFEQLRLTNADFAESVALQETALAGIKRMGQRAEIAQLAKAYHVRQVLKKWLYFGSAIVILGTVAVILMLSQEKEPKSSKITDSDTTILNSDLSTEPLDVKNQSEFSNDTTYKLQEKEITIEDDEVSIRPDSKYAFYPTNITKEEIKNPILTIHSVSQDIKKDTFNKIQILSSPVPKIALDNKFVNSYEFPVPQHFSSYFENGLVGLKDTLGNVVLRATYDSIGLIYTTFSSKYEVERYVRIVTRVRHVESSQMYFFTGYLNKKWYLIGSNFKQLNSFGYDEITDSKLFDGLILVKNDGKYGILDYTGNLVLNCEYDKIVNEGGKLVGYKGERRIKINAISTKSR